MSKPELSNLLAELLQEFLDDYRPDDEYHNMGCRGAIDWKECTCPTHSLYFRSKKAIKEFDESYE